MIKKALLSKQGWLTALLETAGIVVVAGLLLWCISFT